METTGGGAESKRSQRVVLIHPRPARVRRRMLLYACAAALAGAGLTLAIGVPLARHHASVFGVAPDLSTGGSLLTNTWGAPLAAFMVGVLLLAAGVGEALYLVHVRQRGIYWPIWEEEGFWLCVVLLALGVWLSAAGAPAALDATLAPPQHITGIAHTSAPDSQGVTQANSITIRGHALRLPQDQAASVDGKCVTLVYGPNSTIVFSLRSATTGCSP